MEVPKGSCLVGRCSSQGLPLHHVTASSSSDFAVTILASQPMFRPLPGHYQLQCNPLSILASPLRPLPPSLFQLIFSRLPSSNSSCTTPGPMNHCSLASYYFPSPLSLPSAPLTQLRFHHWVTLCVAQQPQPAPSLLYQFKTTVPLLLPASEQLSMTEGNSLAD